MFPYFELELRGEGGGQLLAWLHPESNNHKAKVHVELGEGWLLPGSELTDMYEKSSPTVTFPPDCVVHASAAPRAACCAERCLLGKCLDRKKKNPHHLLMFREGRGKESSRAHSH